MENKFIPGDQVTFINEKQSGTVTKIINAQLVAVDIGDGFEIPTSVKEIVKIQKHSSAEQVQTTAESQKVQPVSENPFTLLKAVPDGTITFCFSPAASGAVNQGDVMGYIVNRTGNDVVFTLLSRKGKRHFGISRGVIEDTGVVETALFTRSELMDTECLVFQGLLFRKGETDASATIRKDIPLVLPGFTEKLAGAEGRFAFSASVLIYQPSLIEPDDLKMLREKLDASALKENMTSRKEKKKVTDHVPEGILLTEKTIDLHIEELVDNASGMSSEEMLKTQLRKFHEEMDLAMRSHLKKIIFIHGIGNGTLKNVIRKELRDYSGVAFRDADARKYGNGATEVMIVG